MATKSSQKAAQSLCCVTVGHVEVLMPADAGLKVVMLLRGAMRADLRYEELQRVYEIRDELEVEFVAVKASQVRAARPPASDKSEVLAIGLEPLKLPRP